MHFWVSDLYLTLFIAWNKSLRLKGAPRSDPSKVTRGGSLPPAPSATHALIALLLTYR